MPLDIRAKTFGERIVNYRRLLGITQKELARALGIDPSALGKQKGMKANPKRNF